MRTGARICRRCMKTIVTGKRYCPTCYAVVERLWQQQRKETKRTGRTGIANRKHRNTRGPIV